jgi:hypothetical protein
MPTRQDKSLKKPRKALKNKFEDKIRSPPHKEIEGELNCINKGWIISLVIKKQLFSSSAF